MRRTIHGRPSAAGSLTLRPRAHRRTLHDTAPRARPCKLGRSVPRRFDKTGTNGTGVGLRQQLARAFSTGRSTGQPPLAPPRRRWSSRAHVGLGRERGGRRTESKYWNRVARAADAHEGRVVISSEGFALADDAALDRIVDRLGAQRLHAVFTLRPMSRLLASSWQQYLSTGRDARRELAEERFAAPPECPPDPQLLAAQRPRGDHGALAQRLGPDRVSLVVLDEGDRENLFRTFEHLVALPSGLLVPDAGAQRQQPLDDRR